VKVALVVPGFSAHEQDWCIPALLDYTRALAKQAEVHVFTLRWPERGGAYRVYGAQVHALDGRQHLGLRVLGLWARAVGAISAEHKRGRFDALHGFWLDEPGWVAAWAGQRLGVRVVLSLAGGELCRMPDIGYGLLLLRGRGRWLRAAARRAAALTAGSRYLCGRAEAYFCQHRMDTAVQYAPLGVDLERFAPAQPPAGGERVVNAASLTLVKDQALLLRSFRRVAARRPRAELVIAGEGPLRGRLEAQAAGLPVRFAGEVRHEALRALYTSAAVAAQSSRHEAQGMAILEAGACGTGAVGTPVGVLPEVGQPAANEAALAETLIELLADARRRRALAEAARARVVEGFELAAAVARFVRLYAGELAAARVGRGDPSAAKTAASG
jgi:glycosyltransferase involved in cell wall biosynthesis